jgi:hypothetical protein
MIHWIEFIHKQSNIYVMKDGIEFIFLDVDFVSIRLSTLLRASIIMSTL